MESLLLWESLTIYSCVHLYLFNQSNLLEDSGSVSFLIDSYPQRSAKVFYCVSDASLCLCARSSMRCS